MITNKDLQIIAHLRQDSRKNLTLISKEIAMPISTLFDRIKRYNNSIITRNTVLVDFKKLGYNMKLNILIKTKTESRDRLRKFLEDNVNINSIYRVNNGYDFIIEGIFKNLIQVQAFEDTLEQYDIQAMQQFYILEEVKEEGFISQPDMIESLSRKNTV